MLRYSFLIESNVYMQEGFWDNIKDTGKKIKHSFNKHVKNPIVRSHQRLRQHSEDNVRRQINNLLSVGAGSLGGIAGSLTGSPKKAAIAALGSAAATKAGLELTGQISQMKRDRRTAKTLRKLRGKKKDD